MSRGRFTGGRGRVWRLALGAGLGLLQVGALVQAQVPAADYGLIHRSLDAGGARGQSASYSLDGSLGGFAGVGQGGVATLRQGYSGELNEPPGAQPDTVSRIATRSVKLHVSQLLANDSDPDRDALTLVSLDATSQRGVPLVREGPWVLYPAPPGLTNNDTFAYVASDGYGWLTVGTVEVQVGAPDVQPTYTTLGIQLSAEPPGVQLRFVGIPGRQYRIQATDNLTAPAWVTLGQARADATGLYHYFDAAGALPPGRYYRSVSP